MSAQDPLVQTTEPTESMGNSGLTHSVKFRLTNSHTNFGPHYPPDNPITFHKARDLSRTKGMCGGESVNDMGSKNIETSIAGYLRQRERPVFESVLASSDTFLLETDGWSGQVRVAEGEYRGPMGWDSSSSEILWRYKLDLVSTGKSEYDQHFESGIIQ